jgi:hypothetical protein
LGSGTALMLAVRLKISGRTQAVGEMNNSRRCDAPEEPNHQRQHPRNWPEPNGDSSDQPRRRQHKLAKHREHRVMLTKLVVNTSHKTEDTSVLFTM